MKTNTFIKQNGEVKKLRSSEKEANKRKPEDLQLISQLNLNLGLYFAHVNM